VRINLHIHTNTGFDSSLPVNEVFREAKKRNIGLMSIIDHDSIVAQDRATALAGEYGISYINGVELNVTLQYFDRSIPLDFLGYRYDINNQEFKINFN